MTNQQIEKCLKSLIIREMEMKTAMKFHYKAAKWLKLNELSCQVSGRMWSNRNPRTPGGSIDWFCPFENHLGVLTKARYRYVHDPEIPHLSMYAREVRHISTKNKQKKSARMFRATILKKLQTGNNPYVHQCEKDTLWQWRIRLSSEKE